MTKNRSYQFGILAEKIAMFFLRLKGYKILEWRYKSRFGEVDIIAKKSAVIVAIEVKARTSKILIEEVLRPRQIERVTKSLEFFIFTSNVTSFPILLSFFEDTSTLNPFEDDL